MLTAYILTVINTCLKSTVNAPWTNN